MSLPHKTKRMKVWAEVDEGIAEFVEILQNIEGVTTQSSCQGTIGEGGPNPYRAQVMCTWTPEGFKNLVGRFDVLILAESDGTWGYVHPVPGTEPAVSSGGKK